MSDGEKIESAHRCGRAEPQEKTKGTKERYAHNDKEKALKGS